jgi:hypothetical protein
MACSRPPIGSPSSTSSGPPPRLPPATIATHQDTGDERQDFVAAQHVRATLTPRDGERRTYLLAGLMRCGYCGRRMDAHWANGRAGYRCRNGRSNAIGGRCMCAETAH